MAKVSEAAIQKIVEMRRNDERPQPVKVKPVRPTPEQEARHDFQSAGMARKKIIPIDNLLKRGRLDERRHKALAYYADQKALAESSILQDSLGKLINPPHGDGYGPSPKLVEARREIAFIERELGSLLGIAHYVAHELYSLTKWIRMNGGGRVKCETVKGKQVCKDYAEPKEIDLALLDLKFAADRIDAAIQARNWA